MQRVQIRAVLWAGGQCFWKGFINEEEIASGRSCLTSGRVLALARRKPWTLPSTPDARSQPPVQLCPLSSAGLSAEISPPLVGKGREIPFPGSSCFPLRATSSPADGSSHPHSG